MAATGSGLGLGASVGLEAATLQKLALRRKKVLGAEETELYELAQAAGTAIDPDVFKILLDLLNLNVAPIAVFQMLKSMCAGQRQASDPQDSVSMSLPTSETRGQNSARKKQKWPHSQQCTHTGRTWQPGRIHPQNAPTAQCYQATQDRRAREEHFSEQHIRWKRDCTWLHHPPFRCCLPLPSL